MTNKPTTEMKRTVTTTSGLTIDTSKTIPSTNSLDPQTKGGWWRAHKSNEIPEDVKLELECTRLDIENKERIRREEPDSVEAKSYEAWLEYNPDWLLHATNIENTPLVNTLRVRKAFLDAYRMAIMDLLTGKVGGQ